MLAVDETPVNGYKCIKHEAVSMTVACIRVQLIITILPNAYKVLRSSTYKVISTVRKCPKVASILLV